VPAGARSSLHPLFEEGGKSKQSSGEIGRENGKVCLQVEVSVGEGRYQHTLRHCERRAFVRRSLGKGGSNPEPVRRWILDCVAALAM